MKSYLKVLFQEGGAHYYYSSPVIVKKGQYVLVNVYGNIIAVKVIATSMKKPSASRTNYKEVKDIAGVGWLMHELSIMDAPDSKESVPEPTSFMNRIFKK